MEKSLEDRIEANANLILWCVHVLGPDDVYAEPSHAEAVRKADKLNQEIWASPKSPEDVLCFAFADVWPWSREQHAESMNREDKQEAGHKKAIAI